MTLNFSKEEKDKLIPEVQKYFEKQTGERLGNLDAGFVIDFFISKLGPQIYNQALRDAKNYVNSKMVDLDEGFYSLEKAER